MTIEEKWAEIDEAQQLRNCAEVYRRRFARKGDPADLRRAARFEAEAAAIERKYDAQWQRFQAPPSRVRGGGAGAGLAFK
jgi:hypothetical protein